MGSGRFLRFPAALLLVTSFASGGTARHAAAMRTGNVITVPPNGDLQRAIDAANPGDIIALPAGAQYVGPFHLPRKNADGWITIQSSAAIFRRIPAPGTRVQPADAAGMAKILAPLGSAITADPGAHHYRLVGLEIAPTPGVYLTNVIDLGSDARTQESLAHHLSFERCYIHGDPAKGSRRGIALNSAETTVVDSYISDFKEVGADSQAIESWNGSGPFHIINNFLQGAGENVLFGGADPSIPNLVPSDIEIRRNTISKPLQWRIGDPAYQGTPWSVKNLLELKNARRVVIDGNTLEYNWPHAQNGFAILFTVRNQDGASPWSTVEDVTFSNNIVRHVAAGMNILGFDDIHSSGPAHRLTIRNNLFSDVGGSWTFGRLFQLLNGAADVTVDHNTAFQTDAVVFAESPTPMLHFVFTNNIVNPGGINGTGTGQGAPTLNQYFPGWSVRRNVLIGANPGNYPSDNFFPGSVADVRMTDPAAGNVRLATNSDYRGKATDGSDIGVDMTALMDAINGSTTNVIAGRSVGVRDALDVTHETTRQASLIAASRSLSGSGIAVATIVIALSLLFYVYVGYPAGVWAAAKYLPQPIERRAIRPSVTILVVAHNERERIERRIVNLMALEHSCERVDIVIASDGSTDDTVAKATRFGEQVRVVAFPIRRGKPAVLNDIIPRLESEIVVLADARQDFDRSVLPHLLSCFGDPNVGCVSGELMLVPGRTVDAAAEGATVYWNYEKLIRCSESQVDSTVGATGAIYAIRRSLFETLPADTILDDVLIPLRIARRGYRVVFEPRARAYDSAVYSAGGEFTRKARTMAGNVQLFARERWLLRPATNRLWFQTVSHKVLRLALPLLYVLLFVANLVIADHSLFRWLLLGQALFYGAAVLGCVLPRTRALTPLLVVPYEICFLNLAVIVGVLNFFAKRQHVTWDRPSAIAAQ